MTSPRGCGGAARQAAARCSSVPGPPTQSPSIITPVQTADHTGQDQRIAEAEFLDRRSRSRSPAGPPKQGQSRRPAMPTIIELNPPAAPEMLAAAMPRYRHIVRIANRQLLHRFLKKLFAASDDFQQPFRPTPFRLRPRYIYGLPVAANLLRCIRRITPQFPITWKWNCAIWMPGNRLKARTLGQEGHRVTNSHVIHHDFGHRYALAALDGADLRRSRHCCAGGGRVDRGPHVPRLRTRLGRLHPRRICRPAAAHVRLRLSRTPARCRSPISICMAAASTWRRRCCTRSFRSNCSRRAACSAPSSA